VTVAEWKGASRDEVQVFEDIGTVNAIYTLCNDVTLEWLSGLMGSLERCGSALPVVIIPYDGRTEKLCKEIKGWKNASLWEAPELPQLDQIGLEFARGGSHPMFRKLSIFWGPYDVFCYFDADIIVGEDPGNWMDIYRGGKAACDLVVTDDDAEWVFKPGRLRERFAADRRPAVNAGFWLGRRGLVSLGDVEAAAGAALDYRAEFISEYGDQSFWNFLMWWKGLQPSTFPALGSRYADRVWAPQNVRRSAEGEFVAVSGRDAGRVVPFLHWAGLKAGPDMANWHLYLESALSAGGLAGRARLLFGFFQKSPRVFLKNVPRHLAKKALTPVRRARGQDNRRRNVDGPMRTN